MSFPPLGRSSFFAVFLSRGYFLRLCLSIPCLLLPILSFCWGWGHFLGGPSEPQSGRVSPGGGVGGKQAWALPPGADSPILRGLVSIAVWCPCSGLIWGKGREETVLILSSNPASPGHLLCVSRKGPYPLWASVSLPVNRISLPLERFVFPPLLWSLGNSELNVCLILFYVETTVLGSLLPTQPHTFRHVLPRQRDPWVP